MQSKVCRTAELIGVATSMLKGHLLAPERIESNTAAARQNYADSSRTRTPGLSAEEQMEWNKRQESRAKLPGPVFDR